MNTTRAKLLMAGAALCGSLGLGLIAQSAPAAAAPVTIGGCPTSTGSTDTATIAVTFDDAPLVPGTIIPLHDRTGTIGAFYNGVTYDTAAPDNAMSSPVCGVQRLASGALSYGWLYCTEKPLNVCGNAPWLDDSTGASATTLTTLAKARLAYVIDNLVDNSTTSSRSQSQRLVWCVTENVSAGGPAPAHIPGEPALTCPDWTAVDPTLNLNPAISIAAAPATATAGGVVTFTVTTNVSPLAITSAGVDGLALCAPQAGVTYAGGTLTIADPVGGKQAALCATKAAAGTGSVTATIAGLTVSTLQFWQRTANDQFCQGMLSTQVSTPANATAQASAQWQAASVTTIAQTTTTIADPGTPTTTTDPGTPTTTRAPDVLPTTLPNTISGTLPRTGASRTTGTVALGALLLLAGVGLVVLGRRAEAA